MDGLAASGWKLVYTDHPSVYESQHDARKPPERHMYNFIWSIGLSLTKKGEINDVLWNGPAFEAGVSSGALVVAVNGEKYSNDVLKDAITTAKGGNTPIKLLIKYQGGYRTVPVAYYAGLQYLHLVRVKGTPDYLSRIIAPRK